MLSWELFKDSQEAQLGTLIQRRIADLFAPFEVDFDSEVDLDMALDLLHNLRPNDTLKIIKTWLNGWVTSRRMHEELVLPCLLGCRGCEDSLRHYIMCPHVFAFCKYFFNSDSCPLIRLGVKHPSINNLKILSCVFSAYHALKGQVRSGNLVVQEDTDDKIRTRWSVFAEVLDAEAGERDIDRVAFSLPKCISFLARGAHCPAENSMQEET